MERIESPQTTDSAIERDIQAKGKTAPRVTPADLQANIVNDFYFTAAEGMAGAVAAMSSNSEATQLVGMDEKPLELLTFCVLLLKNGFTVTGESACASPENFDPAIGRKIARQNAEQKVWPLLGYQLKTELARQVLTEADATADLAGTLRPAR